MKELSDMAIRVMDHALDELFDKIRHYPDEYAPDEVKAYEELSATVRAEAKRRKFWWAK